MAAYVISIMQRINVQKQEAQVLIPARTRGSPADTEGGALSGGPHRGVRPWHVGGHTARVIMWRGQNNNASRPHGNTRLRL